MKKPIERRVITSAFKVETRADAPSKISGHAAKFDVLSEDLGGFRERIAPGSFAKTIQSADVRALFNHDANFVLGRNKAGTLRLSEDSAGLAIEIDAPTTALINDLVLAPMQRGDINQMSFGFRTLQDKWAKLDGEWVRTLLEVELFDVSPVTYPAYPQTDVAVRSLEEAIKAAAPPDESWRIESARRRLLLELAR
jgi:HK97 family phage prohead protease